MGLCEVNYMMLLRLLADKEQVGQRREFYISDFLSYRIDVDEVTKYTSLITMSQDADIGGTKLSKFLRPKMVIRLYHDARMAEVIKNQDIGRIHPRYDYPNNKMHLPDEKQQINQFLKEWLQLSLQLGQTKVDLTSHS
ncbi:phosphohydrolase [Thalassotalea marina]|uniref:Phosphohydrolase n=2 Tax=Thalassotalea marina TaxID=1673741 RepID=A0A919BF38_9GAMM|nr:phosphohydrolase [Thalassotalea marina]